MLKCCICGKEVKTASAWVCSTCTREHGLPFMIGEWPEWALSERRREEKRRRFEPSYGVGARHLSYAPYRRQVHNKEYRKANKVRRANASPSRRVGADNLLYSTGDDPAWGDDHGQADAFYGQILEGLPVGLRERLGRNGDLMVILGDAIRSLPLISQRALKASMGGYTVAEIADAEGLSEQTMQWLLDTARSRVQDILVEKAGADDGQRFH